ncbi:MAG: hypothetical protein WDN69_24305 [Aliidongia sp.]
MAIRLLPEYIVLILALGAARAWLFPAIGPDIDNHLIWIVLFALAGTLFVIPTAGEVPIIQAMLALGMGVGPAGALLMTLRRSACRRWRCSHARSGRACWPSSDCRS